MHCLSEKLISKILFSAKLHSSGIDFPYSTVVGTVTTINLGSAFEMPPPRRRCGAAVVAAAAAVAHDDDDSAATVITHTIVHITDYGQPMKAQIKDISKIGPMWQTKYGLAVPKNLGL